MLVRVLGQDFILLGDFEVESYTVHAIATLTLRFADGRETTFDLGDWIDINHLT